MTLSFRAYAYVFFTYDITEKLEINYCITCVFIYKMIALMLVLAF